MGDHRQSVDKTTCKPIFRAPWESFQQRYPRSQQRDVQTVIDKMLGCGELASGSSTYVCAHCLEEKRVACSGKRSVCLSCCKVSIDQWVAHIGQTLSEGVSSRHVVLTVPQALHLFFHRDRSLRADRMQGGVAR